MGVPAAVTGSIETSAVKTRSMGGLTIFMAFSSAIKTSLLCNASGTMNDAGGNSLFLAAEDSLLISCRGEDGVSVAWDDSSVIDVVRGIARACTSVREDGSSIACLTSVPWMDCSIEASGWVAACFFEGGSTAAIEMEDVMSEDAIVTVGEFAPLSAAKLAVVVVSPPLCPCSSIGTFDAD